MLAAWVAWCALLVAWIPGYLAGRARAPTRADHRGLQLAATALLFGGFLLLLHPALPGQALRVTRAGAVFGISGLALTLGGITFAIWARRVLGRNWSGLMMGLREGHELVRTGPYAIVRHPIYTGLIFAMLGTALTVGTLPAYLGVAAGLAGILLRVSIDERLSGGRVRRRSRGVPAADAETGPVCLVRLPCSRGATRPPREAINAAARDRNRGSNGKVRHPGRPLRARRATAA